MYFPRTPWPYLAAAVLLPLLTSAQSIDDSLSFGHKGRVSPDGSQTLPGWTLSGSEYIPEILSDRVILTPPAPGNKRGGIISSHEINSAEWKASLDFRASGQERGSGNLNIWLAKPTQDPLSSVYTVEKFDGLVLVIDQYGGSGGAIRGFLNDNTVNFRAHHNLDEMAFGHCTYAYRNLGRMSNLILEQRSDGFEVSIDGQSCFKSNIIRLPSGYRFGISASSAENPDSYEVSKFTVSTSGIKTNEELRREPPVRGFQNSQQNYEQMQQQQQTQQQQPGLSSSQLESLVQNIQNTLNIVQSELRQLEQRQSERQDELRRNWGSGGSSAGAAIPYEQLNKMESKILSIEQTVQRVQRDIEGRDYKKTLDDLQRALRDTQTNLMSSLPQSMSQIVSTSSPSMWLFVFVVVAFQVMLAGSYVVYKQRRANAPKKFL